MRRSAVWCQLVTAGYGRLRFHILPVTTVQPTELIIRDAQQLGSHPTVVPGAVQGGAQGGKFQLTDGLRQGDAGQGPGDEGRSVEECRAGE